MIFKIPESFVPATNLHVVKSNVEFTVKSINSGGGGSAGAHTHTLLQRTTTVRTTTPAPLEPKFQAEG